MKMIATTNGLEYMNAGDAYWDAEGWHNRYMGEFPERVAEQDVERIQESYQKAREFAEDHGWDVSGLPLKLNLLLQTEL